MATTAKEYKSYTDIEHVRARSDMYIGSIKPAKEHRWIIKNNAENLEESAQELVDYNPGLEQCALELLVNAADQAERCKNNENKVTKIKVEQGVDYISVYNNGPGIPIEKHPDTGLYIPEMIFGNLRTSSNYDDTEKRTVGGRNGIGSKAANIFSNKFVIEINTGHKKYYQEFSNGMKDKTVPEITKNKVADYVKITFFPDFKIFGMTDFNTNSTDKIIKKRVYDLSATTGRETSIYYRDYRIENSQEVKLSLKDFSNYMDLYIGKAKRVIYKNERWEVGFALCPYDEPTQISFVNSVCTDEGGSHVTHVLEPVLNKITAELQSKAKDTVIKKQYIKDNVIIFIKALIENPSFSSQLKRKLETKVSDFGSRCDIPEDIITKIAKLGICKNVIEIAKAKEMKDVIKKMDGTKNVRLSDIPNLDDANWAGTSKSDQCTLILTEGLSAKGLAMNGITSAGGRNRWGIFPLKGKFLNIRNALHSQLTNNTEILAINRILGLKEGITDLSKLRYGKVLLFSDQDKDGFHIRGLLINYFTFHWPELVEKGLLEFMITPLIKVFKGNKLLKSFYNGDDYKKWILDEKPTGIREKYYKGLGTSTASEAKEYFSDLELNKKQYTFSKTKDLPIIIRTFDKKQADARKEWIENAIKHPEEVDYNKKSVPIDYFIDRELVQFSIYDNIRSIPNVIDGLKPSQRKVLFGCLKKKLFIQKDGSGETKVAQLSGYISEQSSYHHGEVSLQETIVAMAQDFVGSNNINILLPIGNFGSRIMGGDDAASARYIYTALNGCVKDIFDSTDEKILENLEDEGLIIEPKFYVPIIPMLLVNGSTGIGTGWSTSIPSFNPKDIIHNLKLLIADKDATLIEMNPYYRGFKGEIIKAGPGKWISRGVIKFINENTIEIIELPIGVWKQNFKEKLDSLLDASTIKSVTINDNDKTKTANDVCFRIKLNEEHNDDLEKYIKLFDLEKSISTSNMTAFDENCIIKKYSSVEDILWTFYKYRLSFYQKRKEYLIKTLDEKIKDVSEYLRFIVLVVDDKIVIFRKKKADILIVLKEQKFENTDKLLSVPIHKFTKDEIDKLENELNNLKKQLEDVRAKTNKDLWSDDLEILENCLDKLYS